MIGWGTLAGAALATHLLAALAPSAPSSALCSYLRPSDTLVLHGRARRPERFVECVEGHWPNVHSVFRRVRGTG